MYTTKDLKVGKTKLIYTHTHPITNRTRRIGFLVTLIRGRKVELIGDEGTGMVTKDILWIRNRFSF